MRCLPDLLEEMHAAREYLNQASEPNVGCDCHLSGRSRHCRTFAYSHPEIPEYSVHDIVRIGQSKKKLEYFMDEHIFVIDDVPDDYKLGDAQQLQVRAHKTQKPIIDAGRDCGRAGGIHVPAVLLRLRDLSRRPFRHSTGMRPYQRIPFQFSLHILRDHKSEPEHVEFLHLDRSDPTACGGGVA